MPARAGVFLFVLQATLSAHPGTSEAPFAVKGIHQAQFLAQHTERGLLQTEAGGQTCGKELRTLQDSCQYSPISSCCEALLDFTVTGCWCFPEVVREGGARLQSLKLLQGECEELAPLRDEFQAERYEESCQVGLLAGNSSVDGAFLQDSSDEVSNTYAWKIQDAPHYVFDVTITHGGCNSYMSIGAAKITMARWQVRLIGNGFLLYRAQLAAPYGDKLIFGALDPSDVSRNITGYSTSLADSSQLIPVDMILIADDIGSLSSDTLRIHQNRSREGMLRPTCGNLGECELKRDLTHKCKCDREAFVSGDSCTVPAGARVYYIQPDESTLPPEKFNSTLPQMYRDDANYSVSVLGSDYDCVSVVQVLGSFGIGRCDEAAETAASKGMASVFTSEMEAELLASCALTCDSIGTNAVSNIAADELVAGTLDDPFVHIFAALDGTNSSHARELRLLPGNYTGTGNNRLYIGVDMPSASSNIVDLPRGHLEISSIQGSNHTVIDCMGAFYFMALRGDSTWEGNVRLKGFTVQHCVPSDEIETGGVLISSASGEVVMEDMVIRDCEGTMGVVYIFECSNVLLSNMLFSQNCVRSDPRWNLSGLDRSGNGGGVSIFYSTVRIQGSTFTNNFAELRGGAISAVGHASRLTTSIDLKDVVLRNNCAIKAGGGIFLYQVSRAVMASVRVENNILSHPTSYEDDERQDRSGGGLMVMSTQLEIDDAMFSGNMAYSSGGALRAHSEVAMQMSTTVLKNNTCWGSGGGLTLTSSILALAHTLISYNQAEYNGGAFECIQSSVEVTDTAMLGNVAFNGGGMWLYACHLGAAKMLTMRDNVAEMDGGAAQLSSKSLVSVDNGNWQRNVALRGVGGGIVVFEGSTLRLTHSQLLENSARQAHGGGICTFGTLHLNQSSVMNNTAARGGGASLHVGGHAGRGYTALNAAPVSSILNSRFVSNIALDGGGALHISASAEAPKELQPNLRWMVLNSNFAYGGGAVLLWGSEGSDQAQMGVPECRGCILGEDNRDAYSNPEGYASNVHMLHVAPHNQSEAGGYPLEVPMVVDLVDLYNSTVVSSSPLMVLASIHDESSQACILSGTVAVLSINGVATFSDFIPIASPGTVCTISLETNLQGGSRISTTTTIEIRHCVPGEWLDVDSGRCVRCGAGSVSWSNVTECIECPEGSAINSSAVDIWCPGSSSFIIPAGSWLAPGAVNCASDASCMLDRVYHCDIVKACTWEEGLRAGSSAADVAYLQLCNSKRFSGHVLCGGSVHRVCSSSHFSSFTSCMACASRWIVAVQTCGSFLLLFILVALIFAAFLLHGAYGSAGRSSSTSTAQATSKNAVLILKARTALSLTIGNWQVVGQISSIYGEQAPPFFRELGSMLNLVNLDFRAVLRLECFFYRLFPQSVYQDASLSYWTFFYQAMVLPFFILGITLLAHRSMSNAVSGNHRVARRTLAWLGRERAATACTRRNFVWKDDAEQQAREAAFFLQCSFMASAMLMLMLMHTGTGATAFQIFDCVEWYYEQEEPQLFLRQYNTIQCITIAWTTAAIVACAVILTYTFGFPIFMLMGMKESRRYLLVRLAIKDAPMCVAKFNTWEWIPSSSNDLAKVKGMQQQYDRRASTSERLKKWALEQVCSSKYQTDDDSTNAIDFYVHERNFIIHWRRDTISVAGYHVYNDPLPGGLAARARRRDGETSLSSINDFTAVIEGNDEDAGMSTTKYASNMNDLGLSRLAEEALVEVDGAHHIQVAMLKKETQIDGGELVVSHRTLMDHPYIEMALAIFTQPYEDAMYWYACWDMLRRSLMTGGVILVQMCTNAEIATLYALVLSVVSLTVHKHFDAFKMDEMDQLMLSILVSQFLTQVGIVGMWMLDSAMSQTVLGIFLLMTQLILLCYSMVMMVPAFWPVYVEVSGYIRKFRL